MKSFNVQSAVTDKQIGISSPLTAGTRSGQIVEALERVGRVEKLLLPQPESPAGKALVVIPCVPGIFPAFVDNTLETVITGFVDKNFEATFNFLHEKSGWRGRSDDKGEPTKAAGTSWCTPMLAQVSGPPGSGKFVHL